MSLIFIISCGTSAEVNKQVSKAYHKYSCLQAEKCFKQIPAILAAILNMQISQICILYGRPQAVIHMKIWDPYNKNCGLQTGKCAFLSIIRPFWRPYWICKWATFAYYVGDLKQEYIWKFETPTIKTVDCRQENMLFGAYFDHFGGHIEYANEPYFNNFFRHPSWHTY